MSARDSSGPGAPQPKFGDSLPLPLPGQLPCPSVGSRSAVRRGHRARRTLSSAQSTVVALNELAAYDDTSIWPERPLNGAQRSAVNLIHSAHRFRVWPHENRMAPRAALKKLLRQDIGYGTAPQGATMPYKAGCVSLPDGSDDAPLLANLLEDRERQMLASFSEHMLRPAAELGAIYDDIASFADFTTIRPFPIRWRGPNL